MLSGDIYLSFGISLSNPVVSVSLSAVSKLFFGEMFENFLILSEILLPIESSVASTVFF